MSVSIRTIRFNLELAENIHLGCTEFPHSSIYYVEEDAARTRLACLALVTAYNALQKLDENHPSYLRRMHNLARKIVPLGRKPSYTDYIFNYGGTPEEDRNAVRKIATKGRLIDKSEKISEQDRIGEGRLFLSFDDFYAASIPEPKRGCSASVCTNCFEPISFCTQKCPCCNLDLIGPFEMPDIETWEKLDIAGKRLHVAQAFASNNHGRLTCS